MKNIQTRTWILLAALMAPMLAAQTPNPAATKLRAMLAAMESDEAAARFVEEHFDAGHFRETSPASIAKQIRAIGRQSGGVEIESLQERGPHEAEALLKARQVNGKLMMRLGVAKDAPHRITGWGTMPAVRPYVEDLLKGTAATEAERLALVRKAVERAALENKFSGVVLIARGEKVLLETAAGLARLDPPTVNTPKTKFHLGSMPKMFTATAALQLAQSGKLKLDEPIATYLPDYPNQALARKITMHHLLTHTSGLGDYFGPEFDRKKDSIRKLEDYLPFFADKPLRFAPGERWAYSNAGMHVAGIVIERVSGLSYYDYVQKYVFDAAGMKATGNNRADEDVEGLADGLTRFNTQDVFHSEPPTLSNKGTLPPRGGPAGGGYSTVGDLHRFARALAGQQLLDAKHTALLTEGKVAIPMGPGAKYAYGFEEMEIAGRRSIGHSGGAPGMNAVLRAIPDLELVVVVLSNFDPPFAQFFGQRIAEIMLRP